MDLATIQLHLDNFVDTWAGWAKVFANLGHVIFNSAFAIDSIKESGSSAIFPALSR